MERVEEEKNKGLERVWPCIEETGAGRCGSLARPWVPQYNVSGCRDTGEGGAIMDQVMPLLLPLLLLRGGVEEVLGMEMVSRLPMKGTITKEGSPLTLSCSSSSPWFFCLWHSPLGGKQCAIQEAQVISCTLILL